MRMVHETRMHRDNAFITLTYANDALPPGGSLVPRDLKLFFKKLRQIVHRAKQPGIRFYACGEYGDLNLRPHYHAVIFGNRFPDRKRHSKSDTGEDVFTSDLLSRAWSLGHATTQDVSPASCAYVARYVMKKYVGKNSDDHYSVNLDGVPFVRHPEFARMSNRPGIGASYCAKYGSEALEHDNIIIDGREMPPPRYYHRLVSRRSDGLHKQVRDPRRPDGKLFAAEWSGDELVKSIKQKRKVAARKQKHDNTPERLAVREQVTTLKSKSQKRTL